MIQQIGDSQQLILTLMSLLSESPTPWPINAELGELGALGAPRGPLFRFLRYDIKLEEEWLRERIGETVTRRAGSPDAAARRRGVDAAAQRARRRGARRKVKPEDWAV